MAFMVERGQIYEFEIVGGGFDGAPGLKWLDDGVNPPPEQILVGRCEKDADCGAEACRVGVAHISFWTLDEDDIPVSATSYAKQSADADRGRAVYVVGGLTDPRNFGAAAKVPDPLAVLAREGDSVTVTMSTILAAAKRYGLRVS